MHFPSSFQNWRLPLGSTGDENTFLWLEHQWRMEFDIWAFWNVKNLVSRSSEKYSKLESENPLCFGHLRPNMVQWICGILKLVSLLCEISQPDLTWYWLVERRMTKKKEEKHIFLNKIFQKVPDNYTHHWHWRPTSPIPTPWWTTSGSDESNHWSPPLDYPLSWKKAEINIWVFWSWVLQILRVGFLKKKSESLQLS